MKKFIFSTTMMLSMILLFNVTFAKTKQNTNAVTTNDVVEYPKVENSNGIVGFKLKDFFDTTFSSVGKCKIYKNADIRSLVFDLFESSGNTGCSVTRSIVVDKSLSPVTLRDLVGDNYENVIYDYIKKQIDTNIAKGENGYFQQDDIIKYDVLKEAIKSQQFAYYVKDNNIIFLFDKSSIACGAKGQIEFKMKLPKDKIDTVNRGEIIFKK